VKVSLHPALAKDLKSRKLSEPFPLTWIRVGFSILCLMLCRRPASEAAVVVVVVVVASLQLQLQLQLQLAGHQAHTSFVLFI